ncbi:Soluble guanylate cyclase 88E [Tetrabaena socialis]|uniref:Soluble guanylate cyclase 88E n=1 Tax=Tetrabaena socialis TaxID=47790 RepID=A0A2J8AF75_9CHLO|nr:Soluble guanylate cyclase 88E [Tetrabaena socialis]|eukprot:PNH11171.1 Soluble guanylate cyclase 88E [Tetrabaena socialis]
MLPALLVSLTPEEEERLGGRGQAPGVASTAKGHLPGVTLASVAAGAEKADLKLSLAVIEELGADHACAIYRSYGLTFSYVSPGFCALMEVADPEEAVKGINASISGNSAIREGYASFMKLLIVGSEVAPCVTRAVMFFKERRSELLGFWMYPVLVYDGEGAQEGHDRDAAGADDACGGSGAGHSGAAAAQWRPPRLGFVLYTSEQESAACEYEAMLRDHMGLKYTPNPITMVNEDGFIMTQNPASTCTIGVQGYELRLPGSPRFNYLAQLFSSDPALEAEMRSCTATGKTWSRLLRISDSPILRAWLELEEGEVRWHDVQVSSLRDPLHPGRCFMVTEQDVTAAVLAQERVARLQQQQHALLKEILPQQVIEVFLSADKEPDVDATASPILGSSAQRRLHRSAALTAVAAEHEPASLSPFRARFGSHGGSMSGTGSVVLPDGTVYSLRVDSESDSDGSSAMQISRRDAMSLATWHESATILFADIKGFTSLSQQLHPAKVMLFLDTLFHAFDMLLDECGAYKVETIGDCYMASAGLFATPFTTPDGSTEMRLGGHDPKHASKVLRFARQMMAVASHLRTPLGDAVELRIGIHSGHCMSGVVGRRMPRFCLFGDTVNVASRMESTGQPGRIHVSEATRELLPDDQWQARGEGINVKGVGLMKTFWRRWDRLEVRSMSLTAEEEERLGGRGRAPGVVCTAKGHLPGVTLASVAAGAEKANLKLSLSVLEEVGADNPRAIYGSYARTVVYVSPAFCALLEVSEPEKAIRGMNATTNTNTAIRATTAGFMKLVLLGGEMVPCMARGVVYHKERCTELLCLWMHPVLVYDDEGVQEKHGSEATGAEDALGGPGTADHIGMQPAAAQRRPPRLGFMMHTNEQESVAHQHDGMLRDHMGLKYTPNPVTQVDEDGFIMAQNPASACAIGIHAYEMRLPGSPRFNYLAQLFSSHLAGEADMRARTATGETWSRRLRISDSPILRTWLELEEGEVRWHDVQVSRLRDPLHLTNCFMVTEQDVTATVLAQERVARLQRQQHALLKEILPQQVIEVILAPDKERRMDALSSPLVSNAIFGVISSSAAGHDYLPSLSKPLRSVSHGGDVSDIGSVVLPDGTVLSLCVDSDNGIERGSAVQVSRRDVMLLATWHESVTVLFADIKGFTFLSQQLHPAKVMFFLDTLYNAFDMLLDECGAYKASGLGSVETIGDCYVVSAGLFAMPSTTPDGGTEMRLGGHDPEHASKVLQLAQQMMSVASHMRTPLGDAVELRIGIHSGPCMSGVVGRRMPRFCLFGDTINVANRMESTGQPGRIHVSEATRELLPDGQWQVCREGIDVKGMAMETFWWSGDLLEHQYTESRDRILNTIAGVRAPPSSSRTIADLNAQLAEALRANSALKAQLLEHGQVSAQALDLSSVSLTPEEEERLGGRGRAPGVVSTAKGHLPGVTLASVAAGAEKADLQLTLSVLEVVGAGNPLAIYGSCARTVVYVSPAFCALLEVTEPEIAIQRMNVAIHNDTAIRAGSTGFMKLVLLGGEMVPCVTRAVVFHKEQRTELLRFWVYPVLVYDDEGVLEKHGSEASGADDALGGPGSGHGDMRPAAAQRQPPRLGVVMHTNEHESVAHQHDGMLRDHMGLKYTPNPVTQVDEDGFIMAQNPASACAIGIHAYEMRMPGSPRFNYLAQLFSSDPAGEADMRACTVTGKTWSRRLRISDSPILRAWLELEEGEVRWHDVQVSRLRDPLHPSYYFMLTEQDVTATVLAQERVARLQRQQHALLKEILPQQVIEVILASDKERYIRSGLGQLGREEDVMRNDGSSSCRDPRTPDDPSTAAYTANGAAPERLGLSGSTTSPFVSSAMFSVISAAAAEHKYLPSPSKPLCSVSQGSDVSEIGSVVLPDGTVSSLRVDSDDSKFGSTAQISRLDVMSLATWHESVTILFADIKGFTSLSRQLHPAKVMFFLDTLYNAFDMLLDECEVRLGGHDPQHASKVLRLAQQMKSVASHVRTPLGDAVELRIGIHSGPCMSGVVGRRMPRFCLFGDTINVASHMESTGQPGRIHVSQATRELLQDDQWQPCEDDTDIKGVGLMKTFWWSGDGLLEQQYTESRDRVLNTIAGLRVPQSSSRRC